MYPLMPGPSYQATDQSIRPVTDREFALFQKLIYSKAGIHLTPAKKALLEARLTRRLRELGLQTFEEYYHQALESSEELVALLNRIATNETHFFREPKQFEFVEKQIIPAWQAQSHAANGSRHIRVWSAACSTGEEPYSIAMMLLDHFPPGSGWDFEIFASDISTRVLGAATDAVWPIAKASEIPQDYLKKFMLKGSGEQSGKMKASAELRAAIHFQRLNLNDEHDAVAGPFDMIFCRNVLIYFDAQSRARVIQRLVNQLAPDGFLFIGHAESLTNITDRVHYVMPTIYSNSHQPHLMIEPKTRRQGIFL